MKHYKTPDGNVFAFEDDGSQDHLITSDMVALTDAQFNALLNPPPSEAQQEADAGAAVKAMLDALAKSWDYDDYKSARTYKGDVIAKFNAEGTALADFGSACFAYLDGIKAGTNPRPTSVEALLAALPSAPSRPVPPFAT